MVYNRRAANSVPPSVPVEGQVSMKVSSGISDLCADNLESILTGSTK